MSVDEQCLRYIVRDLQGLVGPTRAESGCSGCQVVTDSVSLGKVIFFSGWRCELDMCRYLQSDFARTLMAVIDASVSPPKGYFGKLEDWKGLEYLQEVRKRK